MPPTIEIFCSGCCFPNPGGVGGFATAVRIQTPDRTWLERVLTGRDEVSTSNRVDLLGVIAGLEVLEVRCSVRLFSENDYIVNGINRWIHNWAARGWSRSSPGTQELQPLAHEDLWRRLHHLLQKHAVRAIPVTGGAHIHRCNRLASEAAGLLPELKQGHFLPNDDAWLPPWEQAESNRRGRGERRPRQPRQPRTSRRERNRAEVPTT